MDGPSENSTNLTGVYDQIPKPAVPPSAFQVDPANVDFIAQVAEGAVGAYVYNGTLPRSKALLSPLPSDVVLTAESAPYDQYEVGVPLERAADCMREIGDAMYGPEELWKGFRTPNFFRFIKEEPFYLSVGHGGPVMFMNLEDFIQPSTGKDNIPFDKVVDLFLNGTCRGRMHWGKAGWRKHQPCFDGSKSYPTSWCDFGCAVNELDPTNKFASESTVWRWNATMGGKQVPFGSCCSASGFDKTKCRCASSPAC